jgi:hypothetical protein
MKQYGDTYAPKERKLEKSDLPKHSNGDQSRETSTPGDSDCDEQSRKEQEEVIPKKKKKTAKKT